MSTLPRNIDAWWPVNCGTSPQDPAQTAVRFAALKSTSRMRARERAFVFPIVGGKVDKDPLGGRIVLKGVDAKLTAQAAKALNESLDTNLFEGGLLIGEATVIAAHPPVGVSLVLLGRC